MIVVKTLIGGQWPLPAGEKCSHNNLFLSCLPSVGHLCSLLSLSWSPLFCSPSSLFQSSLFVVSYLCSSQQWNASGCCQPVTAFSQFSFANVCCPENGLDLANKHRHQDPCIQSIPSSWYLDWKTFWFWFWIFIPCYYPSNLGAAFIIWPLTLDYINLYIMKANVFWICHSANYTSGAHPVGWKSIFWGLLNDQKECWCCPQLLRFNHTAGQLRSQLSPLGLVHSGL